MIKQFEITGKCNLSCEYCYNKKERDSWGDMDLNYIIKNVNKDDLVFIGGGEPLLHRHIEEITDFLADITQKTVLSTNGTIYEPINKKIQLQINFPAITPEIYEKITQSSGENLERTLKNIEKYKTNPLLINTPVYQENFYELENISNYCSRKKLPLRITPLICSNGLEISEDFVKKLKRKTLELILQGKDIVFTENNSADFEYHTPKGKTKNPFK